MLSVFSPLATESFIRFLRKKVFHRLHSALALIIMLVLADSDSLLRQKDSSDGAALSLYATGFDPSHVSSKGEEKVSSINEQAEGSLPPKTQAARPNSSASSTSDRGGAASTSASRGLSSSSSVGSLSSEKSSLNPYAKVG